MKISLMRYSRSVTRIHWAERFTVTRVAPRLHAVELWVFGRVLTWLVGHPQMVDAYVSGYLRAV